MKQLKKKDLIIGEIYSVVNQTNSLCVFKHKYTDNDVPAIEHYAFVSEDRNYFKKDNIHYGFKNLKLATPEEKHWLNCCITANKFITFEEAMKSFIPEYVECINNEDIPYGIIGRIYKFNNLSGKHWGLKCNLKCANYDPGTTLYFEIYKVKPSTKEAYDAQFKENENTSKFINDTTVINKEGEVFKVGDIIKSINSNLKDKIISFRWKNDKSEICAVLPNIPNGIGLDKIELYSEPIVKELSLLEQAKLKYPIGTKFKNAYKFRSDYNQIFEITKIDSFKESTVESHGQIGIYFDNKWLYFDNKWAEIVEDFKLPETWWITIENERQLEIAKQYFSQHLNSFSKLSIENTVGFVKSIYLSQPLFLTTILPSTKQTNPQITFEQFEQYVLHNGFKVGDIISNGNQIIYDLQYIDGYSVAFYKYAGSNNTNSQCRILTKNIVR